jgi:hypothetical protein
LLASLSKEINRLILLLEGLRSSRVLLDVDLRPVSLTTEIKDLLVFQSAYYAQHRIRTNQHVPLDLPLVMRRQGKAQASPFESMQERG